MRQETWRFATWDRLGAYLLLGWLPVEIPEPHCHYGWGCVWRCECRLVEPMPTSAHDRMAYESGR
jgi:hypothetical protein